MPFARMCHRQSQSPGLSKWSRKSLEQLVFKYRKLVVCLVAAAPLLLRFLGDGCRMQLTCCPSQVTLDVGCQAGWAALQLLVLPLLFMIKWIG